MNPSFLHSSFLLCIHLVQGSGCKVQGAGGGFAAFFRRWYSRIVSLPL